MADDPHPESVEAIAERLRLIRLAYGRVQGYAREMSQVEFARLVEMSKAAWNNAETGDNRIGLDNAMSIYRRIGVTLEYIYFGNPRLMPHALMTEIEKLQPKVAKRA
jgi:transcriptional regulator with XRE-family HTH domain